jgi:23S rRNA (adenine2503-C2)-methyltransferase
MGMGEPLLNYDAVARSLGVLTDPRQVGLGARRITVSTVGVPERIRRLGREFPQVKLALSLHAAREELRDELVPLNRKYPLAEVLDAVREHCRSTGKKVTFEYVILPGVNDAPADAADVAGVTRGIPARINLIGFNPFDGAPYTKPKLAAMLRFRERLAAEFPGPVTLRRSRGADIQGACGQLSLAHRSEEPSRAAK